MRKLIWYLIVLAFCKSEAFATSFHATNRGGASLVNPKGEFVNGASERVSGFCSKPKNSATNRKNDRNSATRIVKKVNDVVTEENEDEQLVDAKFIAETNLPTDFGDFRLRAYRTSQSSNPFVGNEPCVIYDPENPPFGTDGKLRDDIPIRVHDQCVTGEVFGSNRCDCKEQLQMAMLVVKESGGAIVYLQQEGRGIGLANKVAAYSLQDGGLDTVDANIHLGFAEDARQYGVIPSILRDLHINSIQLMTNNPRKVDRLASLGVQIKNTLPMVIPRPNQHNKRYLETKQRRMQHTNFGEMLAVDLKEKRNGPMIPRRSQTSSDDVDLSN